jgi:hypothetical protein
MGRAVNLDNNHALATNEIDEVGSDRILANKFQRAGGCVVLTKCDPPLRSNVSEGRARDLYAMAEVRACGPTPVDRPSKWLPLTLTLSPLREERNGEREQTECERLQWLHISR